MTERLQPKDSGQRTARRRTPRSRTGGRWGTIPAISQRHAPPAVPTGPVSEPTLFGLPAEVGPASDEVATVPPDAEPEPDAEVEVEATVPPPELVVLRRFDPVGSAALVLAGVAANVSLSLSWTPGEGPTGLSLVQRGADVLDSGVRASVRSGVWEPLAVVVSGGLLVLLGMLLLVPARAHRLVGLMALIVSLGAATAVAFLLADPGWMADGFGPGMWCAVAVPVLGVLGSLKAMLTAPLVTVASPEQDRRTARRLRSRRRPGG